MVVFLGYSNIGCYQATYADIVINHPLLDGVLPGQRRDSVRKCALVAHEVNAPVFGLVHYGHCVISEYDTIFNGLSIKLENPFYWIIDLISFLYVILEIKNVLCEVCNVCVTNMQSTQQSLVFQLLATAQICGTHIRDITKYGIHVYAI